MGGFEARTVPVRLPVPLTPLTRAAGRAIINK